MTNIIFDLEATCWDGAPPNDFREIIQIGAVKLDGYGQQLGTFNQYVRPQVNPTLSDYCSRLTGIDQNTVDRARNFPDQIESFIDWVHDNGDYRLYAWGKMDRELLQRNCEEYEVDQTWLKSFTDLKSVYRETRSLPKAPGLVKALRLENLEFVGTQHQALDDALNLSRLFIKYIDIWSH